MTNLVRSASFAPHMGPRPRADSGDPEGPAIPLVAREWLVTNGLGGYAAGTVSGVITRRFHGLLIAALPAPFGRTMMLNHLAEHLRLPDGSIVQLGAQERPDASAPHPDLARLAEIRLDHGVPVWRYEHGGYVIEKTLVMPHRQNTTYVIYRLLAGQGPLVLELEPWINFRPHEGPLNLPLSGPYALKAIGDRYEVERCSAGEKTPTLRLRLHGHESAFAIEGKRIQNVSYRIEQARGYDAAGDLYSPGYFRVSLREGAPAALVASAEPWITVDALTPEEAERSDRLRRARLLAAALPPAQEGFAAELVCAADQFLITPAGRVEDSARAHATGDEVRTVIAGYHWFTDWGRDTMISFEGLTLVTGRALEAGYILRTFAHYVEHGLIPNMFPEGNNAGLYHTADATLWFFHAVDRYIAYTADRATLRLILPTLLEIVRRHVEGTRFGIGVDPSDGLLRQGQEGYQLTWMDAKVGDLVVTPRRGKAVEINALFYNALCLLAEWMREEHGDDEARPFAERAERVKASFNARFWYPEGEHLYDVIDAEGGGNDAAFRPNQLLAISLPHPVLDPSRWARVVDQVKERLVTPVGLRTLAPGHPDYKPKYFGDLRSRDMAYHQGTVWAWLIGPFVDAWMKVHPEAGSARPFVEGFAHHLGEACIGTISEIFDAEGDYTPRGCVAQAWSVAEVLRCLVKTAR